MSYFIRSRPVGTTAAPQKVRFRAENPQNELFQHNSPFCGEPFELRASLRGVVPDRAVVRFWFEGANPSDHTYTVKRDETLERGSFTARG